MRVVVADDSLLTREGIVRLLEDAAVEVVGQAEDADGLLREVRATAPDAAVVDIRMPPTHTDEGIVAAQRIRTEHPSVAVLVLSHHIAPSYAMQLLDEYPERVGYLLKERVFDAAVLVDALRRITDGETVVDPTIVARPLRRPRAAGPLDRLTEREREVLELVAEGLSNRAIPTRLVVTDRTVETHVSHVFSKLGLAMTTLRRTGASRPSSPTCAARPEVGRGGRSSASDLPYHHAGGRPGPACLPGRALVASSSSWRWTSFARPAGHDGRSRTSPEPSTGETTMRDTYDVRGHDGGRGATDRPDRHRSTSTVVQVAPSDRLAAPPVAGFAAAAPIAGGRCSPWRRRAVVFVIASLAVLSACSGADDAVAPGNGPTIPDGTYEKTVTREEAVAAGVPVSFLDQPDEFLGIDEFHITIRLQDGRYQFLANYVGGTQVGDRGTYTYDASGRLVKTSSSSGCPGCTAVFDWSFEEDALVLEVSEDGGDYPDWTDVDRAITRVYDAGTFQRTD